MSDGTRLVLLRHGESRAQEGGFLGGHAGCTGLSARGRRQAEALRDRLVASGELSDASVVYASILPRAIETAEIVAPALAVHELRKECDLCEGHPGDADGWTYDQLAELTGGEAWTTDLRPVPGWETWSELGERVARALDRLVADHPGDTIVVACHGGVIVHAMIRWLDLGVIMTGQRAWFAPANTSITEFRFASNPFRKDSVPVELVRYNDHAHLAGTDLL